MVVELLRSLFSARIEDDVREPFISIRVSGSGSLGILAPHPIFWIQMPMVLGMQSATNAAVAVACYYLVVKRRGSIAAYLAGYGVILPAVVLFPYYLAQWLGIHNQAMLMGQAGSMFVVFFRTLMAIHGTMPPYVERSWKNFVLFFVAPVQFKFDPKTGDVLPSSSEDFRRVLFKTAKGMALLCVLLGLLIHHSYELFPSPEAKTLFDLFRWSHLLSHLLNNYAMASLTGMGLASGSLVVGTIIQGLTGTTVIELTNSPMTQSTSVSDFWSRRWNSLVHLVLKGGVYVPMRKNGFPASVAAFVTFAASGIFHEYVLTALAMKARVLEDDSFYTPKYGYHLAFFAWNGLAIMMEHAVSDHPFVRWMKNNLPRPVITTLVICTVLPVGHWFTDEYVRIGFFDEIALGLPVMVWIPASQNE